MATFNLGTPTGLITRTDSSITVTNTTTETTLVSSTISASAMNMRNKLKCSIWCSLSTKALLPGSVTIRIKYGSGVLTLGGGALALTGGASSTPFVINSRLSNKGATNSQYLYGEIRQQSSTLTLGSAVNQAKASLTTDSTADQIFTVTAQFSAADVANILVVEDLEVELS